MIPLRPPLPWLGSRWSDGAAARAITGTSWLMQHGRRGTVLKMQCGMTQPAASTMFRASNWWRCSCSSWPDPWRDPGLLPHRNAGSELEQRGWLILLIPLAAIHKVPQVGRLDLREAPTELTVVFDDLVAEGEDIHQPSPHQQRTFPASGRLSSPFPGRQGTILR
jgi:hypothetical protein